MSRDLLNVEVIWPAPPTSVARWTASERWHNDAAGSMCLSNTGYRFESAAGLEVSSRFRRTPGNLVLNPSVLSLVATRRLT